MSVSTLRFDWCAPVISTGGACDDVFPADFAVGQRDFNQLRVIRFLRILTVRHFAVDVDDSGIFQCGGEEVLLLTLNRRAVPFQLYLRQHLTGCQGVVQQRNRFVQRDCKYLRKVCISQNQSLKLKFLKKQDI